MKCGGSRKQDLVTHIRLTMNERGISMDDIMHMTGVKWYRKHTTASLELMLRAMRKVINGPQTPEAHRHFVDCFGE